jgi:tetratricopeptide (TPR) repeat protein
VQRAGDRVRVNVQLIHAATDAHLWAKEFEGTMPDVLDLQRRIAVAIAADITQIAPSRVQLGEDRPRATAAYDAYLLGRYLFWKTDLESQHRAIAEFRRAIAIEPDFAEAYASLARALAGLNGTGFAAPTDEAARAARKAVELDDTLAEAHAARAAVAFDDWDWETAQREYLRALELFPNTEDACACWSLALSAFGRHEEAKAWAGRLASRNPVSAGLQTAYAVVLVNARDYREAERRFNLAIELEPEGWAARAALGELYKVTGRAERVLPLLSNPLFVGSSLQASAYAAVGKRVEALAIVEKLRRKPLPIDLLTIAMVYFHLGDKDRGFEWLERAVSQRVGFARWLNVHPAYDPFRNDPRFVALVKQLRLPSASS